MNAKPKPRAKQAEKTDRMNGSEFFQVNQLTSEFADATSTLFETFQNVQQGFVGLAERQMQTNMARSQELMSSKDPSEALAVQQVWVQEASEQYASEMTRLFDLMQESVQATWSVRRPNSSRK